MTTMPVHAPVGLARKGVFALAFVALVALALGAVLLARTIMSHGGTKERSVEATRDIARSNRDFFPTPEQWAVLTVEPVQQRVFRPEQVTEGKIAVDEDRSTPIFSPYAGRVTRLLVKPGDTVERGQPLFVVEATDMATREFLMTGRDGIYKLNVKTSHNGEEFIRFLTAPDMSSTTESQSTHL